jgi:hypothetical protein
MPSRAPANCIPVTRIRPNRNRNRTVELRSSANLNVNPGPGLGSNVLPSTTRNARAGEAPRYDVMRGAFYRIALARAFK